MKVLELFCGTKSFTKVAKAKGHETFTVDIDPAFEPDLCMDIMQVTLELILEKFGQPDFIWASPPCTTFSIASVYRYWDNGKPKNEKTLQGIAIVKKTIELIEQLKPRFWIIENPRGMLRKQDFMQNIPKNTITYCQYGLEYQKATDLWNNLNSWKPKPMCSPNSPCHVRSPRSSNFGLQSVKVDSGFHADSRFTMKRDASARAIVPEKLCAEILESIEGVQS